MRKNSRCLIILLLIIFGLFQMGGCTLKSEQSKAKEYTIKAKLFYADKFNEKLQSETRTVIYHQGQDKYARVLDELLKGPESKDLVNNIPSGTSVINTKKVNSDLTVNLRGFKGFPGEMAGIMAEGSIVNTMVSLDGVKRVKILIEGKELIGLSGQPRGFMTRFNNPAPMREVTLYFANQQAEKVVPEKRDLTIPVGASREDEIKTIIEALIDGPKEPGHYKTIPPEARVKSVTIENKVVWVDFSQEMQTKHWHGAAGESMTINSIVNTLTELPGIDKVGMTVEGKPLNIEHAVLEEPLGRNPSMIGKD
ncbi:MAG: GerMN domain-containing protein [Chitinophagales bacterium]